MTPNTNNNNVSSQVPSHWPRHIHYLREPVYHSSVPEALRVFLLGPPNPKSAGLSTSRPPVAIRSISDTSHPAHGQYGLFATRKIPPHTRVIVYIGEIHCEDRPESDYDLSLYRSQDGVNVGVDASKMGNEARFINDYRGICAHPNAKFVDERNGETGRLEMGVWSGHQGIKKGEEILVSYGKGWWNART
ncbi:hypothetical protein BDN72DRAFT_829985 [Pluteus cervinus]|uniref:Uncharacterized protein n=1 Tax=Pluteus cervinus TaxID=181527 RepID=A0ACD3BFL4_9AGAR|nr:hypothetical protein BDN72DRAFT_829985 [Pluteus cervinus]